MIPVSLFPSCFANLNLWISPQESVSIPLFKLRYPSHNSWMVLALSVSGLTILSTSVASLIVFVLYRSMNAMRSFSCILCNSAILNLAQSSKPQASSCGLDDFILLALDFKLRNTFRLSFFSLAPLHSGQVFISSIA